MARPPAGLQTAVASDTEIPLWLFMWFGAMMAGHIPRQNLLVVTQASVMASALILALLAMSGTAVAGRGQISMTNLANALVALLAAAFVFWRVPQVRRAR